MERELRRVPLDFDFITKHVGGEVFFEWLREYDAASTRTRGLGLLARYPRKGEYFPVAVGLLEMATKQKWITCDESTVPPYLTGSAEQRMIMATFEVTDIGREVLKQYDEYRKGLTA